MTGDEDTGHLPVAKRPATRCGTFRPGHDVHFLQVTNVAPHHPAVPIEVIDAPGDDVVRVDVAGVLQRLHNHAAPEVIAAWDVRIGPATWTPAATLLFIPTRDGERYFNLSVEPLTTCPKAKPAQAEVDAAFERLVEEAESRSDRDGDRRG
jgi:hypothetical protein